MNEWKLVDESTGNVKYFDSKADAQAHKDDLASLVDGPLTIEKTNTESDSPTDDINAEVVDHTPEDNQTEPEPVDVPESKPALDEDPVDWMPQHFVDEIQGVPTLNRKGYAVMAERFDVSVTAEPIVRASETDFEYAEFEAIAKTEDGTEYSGFGSAHIDRQDGDDPYLLNELAETRAMKRAASWALGLGMTAREEMENTL
jgi:hypothetical protein